MKHIYIYSPSGAVRDKAAFKRGVARLKTLGYAVEIDPDALKSHMRFAGDDATRVAAIHRAAASGADIALTTRGGYGLTRILGSIDYRALTQAIERGTQFVGYSDFTALQNALLAKTGAITWAGPALGEGFGVDGTPDDIMEACFDDLVAGQGEGTGWRLGREDAQLAMDSVASHAYGISTEGDFYLKDAILWGGNLSVLVSQIGTPYFPQISGGILFLEDVGEHPYRIERMLTQLLYSGVLARQKAVVLGQFTEFTKVPHDGSFRLATVVAWLRSQLKVPVLTNLPFGHVQTKVLLPVGASVELALQGREAMVVWGHVSHSSASQDHHGHPGHHDHSGHHHH
ncbi:murein tetrapeptide carboxypeptidase [Comamonadaceae bacterium OS-1]|nr:murein tetrapeptide carboxypeptidase [Comamonadaceae bacterium OS-1]